MRVSSYIGIDLNNDTLYDEDGDEVELEQHEVHMYLQPHTIVARCTDREKVILRALLNNEQMAVDTMAAAEAASTRALNMIESSQKKLSPEEIIDAFNDMPDQELFGMPDEYLDKLRTRLLEDT